MTVTRRALTLSASNDLLLTEELLGRIRGAARHAGERLAYEAGERRAHEAVEAERGARPLTQEQEARAEAFSHAAMAYTPTRSTAGSQSGALPTDPAALAVVFQAAEWILGAPSEPRSVRVNVYNPAGTVVDKVRTVDPADPEVEDDGFITVALTPDGEHLQVRPERPEPRP